MTSLKRKPEESLEVALSDDKGGYGYGTCIQLEEEQVAALGIGNLQAGTRVRVVAYGVVESVRVDVAEGEGKNMSIQLTDMEATPAASSSEDIASRLYPKAGVPR